MRDFYNEMATGGAGSVREHYREFEAWLRGQPADRIERKRLEADLAFRRVGITFAVYGDDAGTERLIPELFARRRIAPVDHYPDMLVENLRSVAPGGVNEPTVVVMTPGMHNSAYFEHAFLAQQMGVELVEGKDLFVNANAVWMRTIR